MNKNNDNNKINKFDISSNDIKYIKKSRNLKDKKLPKSQNLAKSKKKLPKKGIYLILVLKNLNQVF